MGNLSELDTAGQGGGGALRDSERAPFAAPAGIDARFRARSAWLARTERDLAAARTSAEAGCPDWMALAKQLQSMLDAAADADCLTSVDRARLAAQARGIARIAYRRGVEELIAEAETIRGDGASLERDVLVGRADALMSKLKRLKLEPDIHDALRARIALLSEGGSGAPAALEHSEAEALRSERRLFPRYSEPPLTVQLGSHFGRTLNWSLGGLVLATTPSGLGAPGARVDFACWIAGGHRYEDQAVLVRRETDGRLALKMRRFGSTLVELKQECERRGLPPRG